MDYISWVRVKILKGRTGQAGKSFNNGRAGTRLNYGTALASKGNRIALASRD